jgi:hypothetical protein
MALMWSKLCQWKDAEVCPCYNVTLSRTRRKGEEEWQLSGEVKRRTGGRRNNSRCKGVKVVRVRKMVVMLECLLFCIRSGILCKCVMNRLKAVCVVLPGGTMWWQCHFTHLQVSPLSNMCLSYFCFHTSTALRLCQHYFVSMLQVIFTL